MNYFGTLTSCLNTFHNISIYGSTIRGNFDSCKNIFQGFLPLSLTENIGKQVSWIRPYFINERKQENRSQTAQLDGKTSIQGIYESISAFAKEQAFPAIHTAFQTALCLNTSEILSIAESSAPQLAYQAMIFTYTCAHTIRMGIEDCKKQKIAMGISRIFLGSAALLGAGLMAYSQLNPQANVKKDPKICIFTSYTTDNPNRLQMSRDVADRQKRYASAHKYDYQAFEQNLAPGSEPYWSKIGGILKYLNKEVPTCLNPEWIVWVDDDALFTNHNIRIEEVIANQRPYSFLTSLNLANEPHVIVTKDAVSDLGWATSLNTGVLFVKNSDESRDVMKKLFEMRIDPTYNCPEQKGCLHEQQAFHDLFQKERLKEVKIIPQRESRFGINTFMRYNHYDTKRGMYLNYNSDPSINRFEEGDFITQCTGMAMEGYTYDNRKIRNLRAECIHELDEKTIPILETESKRVL